MNCNTTHYRANSSSVPGDPTDLTRKAKELYQIELVSVGCLVTRYQFGYRDAVVEYLIAKYGHDPIPPLETDILNRKFGPKK